MLGRRVTFRGEIIEVVPNARITSRASVEDRAVMERRYLFTALNGATQVEFQMDVEAQGAFKLGTMTFERILLREVYQSLGHLKDVMEAHEHLFGALNVLPPHEFEKNR
jgi:hypothetical protein